MFGIALAIASSPLMALDLGSLEAAQERAGIIDRVKTLLADDSPSVRLAVFEEVMKSDDPVLRSLAFESAFSSDDETLQTAGLRQLLRDRSFLAVEVMSPTEPDQTQAYTYRLWRELMLEELRIDPATDEITGKFHSAANNNTYRFVGQLTRGGWRLELKAHNSYSCVLALTELSGVDLTGVLDCAIGSVMAGEKYAGGNSASLPIRIRLS